MLTPNRRLPILLAAGLVAIAAGAAARAQGPAEPSPEMKKLAFMVGSVTGNGKFYTPGGPVMPWTSRDESRYAMDRKFLRTDSKVTYQRHPVRDGLTMLAWDAKEKVYRSWTFISFLNLPVECSGGFEGEKLVLVSEAFDDGSGSGMSLSRLTFAPRADRAFTYLMEVKPVRGGEWVKLEDGVYTAAK
jgi:hypothetical protein